MVGFIVQPTDAEEEDHNQDSKSRNLKYPLESFDPCFPDLSFADSLLDFDSIKEFFEDSSELDQGSSAKIDFGGFEKSMEMGDKQSCIEALSIVDGSELMVKEESVELEREGNLGYSIEEDMGRVSLVGRSTDCVDAAVVKREMVDDGVEITGVSLVAAPISVVPDKDDAKADVASDGTPFGNVSLEIGSAVNNLVMDNKDKSASDSESARESSSSSTSSFASSSGSGTGVDRVGGSSSCSHSDEVEEEEEVEGEEELYKNGEEGEEEEVRVQLNTELEEGEIEEGEIRDMNAEEMVDKIDEEEEEDGDKMVDKIDEEEEEDGDKMVDKIDEDGDKMVGWSDIEFDGIDEEEEGVGVMQGPIRSKNELKVLPPVPPVDVTLQPHHQMLPVGIVLSIIGAQAIVEGVEKHNPLNEDSILWITEKRSPLGLVDEIFGPVKNPYYVVRYNSESEVPAGIHQGTPISFVPEFAYHVLSEKNLYKKGYDASGENDEELLDDAEFSDDEKETEYRRMQKISKRGMNHKTSECTRNNRNKVNNKKGNWNNDIPLRQQRSTETGQQPNNQNQHNGSATVASMNNGPSSTIGKGFTGRASFFPPFSPMVPTNGVFQPSNGGWVNAMPSQQPHNAFIPGGFVANNVSWPAQNQLQPPYQMSIPKDVPFQQQFNPSQGPLSNGVLPGGQMNLFAGTSPWPAIAGQNCFNQFPFGISFNMQPTLPIMNVGEQRMMPNVPHMEQNLQPPAVASGNIQAPQPFNLASSSNRGRKPYRRGGGHFASGRGRQRPSK